MGSLFQESSLNVLIHNEIYAGDIRRQKTFMESPLTKVKVINRGQLPQFYYEDAHEAIIGRDAYEKVKAEMARRNAMLNPTYCFTGKITCGCCGMPFSRNTRISKGRRYIQWICRAKKEAGMYCGSVNFNEDTLKTICAQILGIPSFREEIFMAQVASITVEENGNLLFTMAGGGTREWENLHLSRYKDDRDPHEQLFAFKRCMVHFAVDDARVKFCTKLAGADSWFLPFDKGYNDGAGNPPNPDGLMTDYLWKDILTKKKLCRIIENYAQVVEETDPETHKKTVKQVFPRYHQLDVVETLLRDVQVNGVGKRYLIQHSAGSGKSNSIAWLAHQLIGLMQDGHPLIDSVIVVTDRRILDKQIRDTIKQFMQVAKTVEWAEHSGDLSDAITAGKRIIITTIEKFPFALPKIGAEHKDRRFAIIIDEAHSGQSGRNSAQMNLALSGLASDDEMDNEDKINAMMEGRKLLGNAS